MIRHQFGQVEFASEHWFRLAASTLAVADPRRRPRDAGQAARGPRPPGRPRRDQRPAREPRRRPARGVDQAGRSSPSTSRSTRRRSTRSPAVLNERVAGRTARRARRRARRASTRTPTRGRARARVGERIVRTLRDYDASAGRGGLQRRPAQRDGGAGVRPEREAPPRLRRAREPRLPRRARRQRRRRRGDVHVFIGEENAPPEMHDVSLVLAPYGRPGRAVGVVGVLGPDADVLPAGDRHRPLRLRA